MAQQQQQQQSALYLDQTSLQCRGGCGFFGNPEWLGYCSICYKQLNYNQQLQHHPTPPPPPTPPPLPKPQPLLQPPHPQQLQPPQTPPSQNPQPLHNRPASAIGGNLQTMSLPSNPLSTAAGDLLDSQLSQIRLSFNWWQPKSPPSDQQQQQHQQQIQQQQQQQQQHQLQQQQITDMKVSPEQYYCCLHHTNKFAKEFLAIEKQQDKSISDLSNLVHDFYQQMNDRFETQFIYKGATPEQLESLNDSMERILNEYIYQVIFARIINEDEEHNMAIQKRIRSLNWITVEHLEIDIDFQHPMVHDLLDKAICQMVEMNSRASSLDKLECIVQCSKTIIELLNLNKTRGRGHSVPGADQFLPVLVFVVIQANPPMLPADMKYLNHFSNPHRLSNGLTGYYFTSLNSALEFIENVNGASLNISEEEFQRYLNGEAVPVTKSQFSTYLCDGLRTMCSNDAALEKLRSRNEARQSKIDNLIEQIDVHLETNRAKLKEMQTFASGLKQRLKPSLPKFYTDLFAQSKELAVKLLPSYMKQTIELSLEPEVKLVDIEPTEADDQADDSIAQQQESIDRTDVVKNNPALEAQTINQTSLSPVDQLEQDISQLQLPEPIQPETPTLPPNNEPRD